MSAAIDITIEEEIGCFYFLVRGLLAILTLNTSFIESWIPPSTYPCAVLPTSVKNIHSIMSPFV